MTRTAEHLQARGKFEAVTGSTGRYIYYRFQWQGQERSLGAEIRSTTGGLQLHRFFAACTKALAGNFEQPDFRPYLPRVHAPLRVR